MRISEIYRSIQGEGLYLGTDSVFVRTSGCNLRCWFCDTPFTSWNPEGRQWSIDAVVESVCQLDCEHVVLTGGEPLLPLDIVPLTNALAARGKFITVETSGSLFRPVSAHLMSISPKLSNSTPRPDSPLRFHDAHSPAARDRWTARHEADRHRPEVINRLIHEFPYQLKFVVDRPADLDEIAIYVAQFPSLDPDRIWLMPQATTRDELAKQIEWLQPIATARGYRFTTHRHIELFDNERGR